MLRNVECSNMYQVNDLLKLTGPVTLLPVYFYVGELSLNSDSITSSSSFPLVGAILPLTTPCLLIFLVAFTTSLCTVIVNFILLLQVIALIYASPSVIFVLRACLKIFQMFTISHALFM